MKNKILQLQGSEILPWIDKIGELRIRVFHDFPYLYEGDLDYERKYLQIYTKSSTSLIALVVDESENVQGATTCLALLDEGPEFQLPFRQAGYDLSKIFYFGESILLPSLRGQGFGKRFFELREAQAQKFQASYTCFCSVNRPSDHPRRPQDYRPLDSFWISRGYKKHPELSALYSWRDIGAKLETEKSLTFWLKEWKTP
jgi:GNAT superfamily N-acetyltransferase